VQKSLPPPSRPVVGGGGPGDNVDEDDLDEAAIERSIREINEAIRRSANGTRKA
jgi:hypothetical protein